MILLPKAFKIGLSSPGSGLRVKIIILHCTLPLRVLACPGRHGNPLFLLVGDVTSNPLGYVHLCLPQSASLPPHMHVISSHNLPCCVGPQAHSSTSAVHCPDSHTLYPKMSSLSEQQLGPYRAHLTCFLSLWDHYIFLPDNRVLKTIVLCILSIFWSFQAGR